MTQRKAHTPSSQWLEATRREPLDVQTPKTRGKKHSCRIGKARTLPLSGYHKRNTRAQTATSCTTQYPHPYTLWPLPCSPCLTRAISQNATNHVMTTTHRRQFSFRGREQLNGRHTTHRQPKCTIALRWVFPTEMGGASGRLLAGCAAWDHGRWCGGCANPTDVLPAKPSYIFSCIISHYDAFRCNILRQPAAPCIGVHFPCNNLHCVALPRNALQYRALFCSQVNGDYARCCKILHHIANQVLCMCTPGPLNRCVELIHFLEPHVKVIIIVSAIKKIHVLRSGLKGTKLLPSSFNTLCICESGHTTSQKHTPTHGYMHA